VQLDYPRGQECPETESSTGTYTVSERPDVGKQIGAGVASIAWLIGQVANRGNIKKAQETLEFIEKYYFRSESPILPGENRNGYITFWSGRGIKTPIRVILFLSDPKTGAEETVTFEFQ